jgi:drug/metabolite transporter (DMT)-like permease
MAFAGYGFVFLAAFLWGLLGPVARFALADGVAPLEVAFWRAVFGAAFFLLHCAVARRGRIARRDVPAFLAFGLVGVSVFFGSYQVAVKEGGAALASILLYTAPAWVALLARLFLSEALSRAKLLALAMAMGGAACVSLGSGGGAGGVSVLGVVCGLVSGLTYALHYVFGKKYLGDYDAATLYVWILPVGALGLAPFVDFTPLAGLSAVSWGTFLFLGLFTTYGAYMAYLAGLRRLAATRVAVVANLEPVIAALMAWVWWGEYFSPMGYVGGALVLGAVFVMVFEATPRS